MHFWDSLMSVHYLSNCIYNLGSTAKLLWFRLKSNIVPSWYQRAYWCYLLEHFYFHLAKKQHFWFETLYLEKRNLEINHLKLAERQLVIVNLTQRLLQIMLLDTFTRYSNLMMEQAPVSLFKMCKFILF